MKQVKLLLFCMIVIVSVRNTSYAQDYNNAVGVRLGVGINASFKHNFTEQIGGEVFGGLIGIGFPVLNAGLLITYHTAFSQLPDLNWYVGAGLNFRTGYSAFSSALTLGPMGVLGLEYNVPKTPLSLGADIAPTLFLLRRDGLGLLRMNGGFFARFILN